MDEATIKEEVVITLTNMFGYSKDDAERFAENHYLKLLDTMNIAIDEYVARQAILMD